MLQMCTSHQHGPCTKGGTEFFVQWVRRDACTGLVVAVPGKGDLWATSTVTMGSPRPLRRALHHVGIPGHGSHDAVHAAAAGAAGDADAAADADDAEHDDDAASRARRPPLVPCVPSSTRVRVLVCQLN